MDHPEDHDLQSIIKTWISKGCSISKTGHPKRDKSRSGNKIFISGQNLEAMSEKDIHELMRYYKGRWTIAGTGQDQNGKTQVWLYDVDPDDVVDIDWMNQLAR